MLYLHPEKSRIQKARLHFKNKMTVLIVNRILKLYESDKEHNKYAIQAFFEDNIEHRIEEILVGKPQKIAKINNSINSFLSISPNLRRAVEYVFNYTWFIYKAENRYSAYNLAQDLDLRTCPYCNRNYTSTVITRKGEKITRPQFDHFFDKSNNPLLALSFYNLIPSCSICNSGTKGSKKFTLNSHLHPYVNDSESDIRFTYKYSDKTKSGLEIEVISNDPSKEKNTIEAFAIEEIYNSHTGELLDLLRTRQYFSDKYLNILKANLLRGVVVSNEDLYRIIFGAEYNSGKFINRPFSKFKKDILKELGVI